MMAAKRKEETSSRSSSCCCLSSIIDSYGCDLFLGAIAAFYVFMAPYTKVEESFNVQAMHDIIYHWHQLEKYDHLEFPGVVPRTFIGAIIVSTLASPFALAVQLLHMPKICNLFTVRLVLGFIILSTLRFFRIQVRRKLGQQVEVFFVILTAIQFHLLFYCTRPLPNILALGVVNLAYAFWFKGNSLAALRCLTFATVVFRCDILLLLCPIGLTFLLTKSVSLWEAMKCCISTAVIGAGMSVLFDSVMWRRWLWPEFEVFWFNSVLNRSSEWGTHALYWYFTSALPRSLLVAYPLCVLGVLVERRILLYILPVFSFVLLYSKLPHKELRFIISSIPMFNVSAAIAASRIYNNRKKKAWKWIYFIMIGSFVVSLGCSLITFLASYENYPGGDALKAVHQLEGAANFLAFTSLLKSLLEDLRIQNVFFLEFELTITCIFYFREQLIIFTWNNRFTPNFAGHASNSTTDLWVHIDPFAAMNGISRFCENNFPWRCKGLN